MRITAGNGSVHLVRRVPLALACVAAALALTACDDGAKKPVTATSAPSATRTPAPVIPKTKPVVTVPKGPPPTTLVTRDLILGTGDFAVPGKTVTINWVGVHYSTGKEFDSSWRTGHTFPFVLGGEEVVPGWDQGVVGMRVGGRRELVIPPDLAYGAEGDQSHTIGPNETLVLVVDLVSVGGRPAGIGNPPPSS
jgi:FKBP-type peptidyl-prolyl cis-trans isomerase